MGVGVVDTAGGDMSLVGYDAIQPPRRAPLPERLHALHEQPGRLHSRQPAD